MIIGTSGVTTSNKSKTWLLRLLDIFFNAFFITVLSSSYWAATTDIIYAHVFPKNRFLRTATTFLVPNVLFLIAYFYQDELQRLHDWLDRSNKETPDLEGNQPIKKSFFSYYNKAFAFRCLYSYIMCIGYVAQWDSYWTLSADLYYEVHFAYTMCISIVSIIAYRVVLKTNLEWHVLTQPFSMCIDSKVDNYCLMWRELKLKNKKMEHLFHWFYYEQVELMIGVFMWKGFWEFFYFLEENGMERSHSLLLSIGIGYGIYFILLIVEYLINKFKPDGFGWLKVSYVRDLVYFVAFIGCVAIWRGLWEGFDYLFYYEDYRDIVIFISHFATFFILMFLKIGTILYTPGGSLPDDNTDYEVSLKKYYSANERIKFFHIQYFASSFS